ncbi:hypothetical protein [Sorangium sp. So ce1000]|uniref:hypothetical protein n=1 Tax=Sorangium sp. So ce1000 TaxID=3133325 RepID=UPI003F61C895
MDPRPIDDAFIASLPNSGIAVIGIRRGTDVAEALEGDDVVKDLASELEVYAILHGSELAKQMRTVLQTQALSPLKILLYGTFAECDGEKAVEYACIIYHRRKDELRLRTHPELLGRVCPDPLCGES